MKKLIQSHISYLYSKPILIKQKKIISTPFFNTLRHCSCTYFITKFLFALSQNTQGKQETPVSIVFAPFITICYYSQIKHVTSFDTNWKYFKANISHRYLENAINAQISKFLIQVLKFLSNWCFCRQDKSFVVENVKRYHSCKHYTWPNPSCVRIFCA